MNEFQQGQKVREKGRPQIMEVVGAVGLGSLSVRGRVVMNGAVRGKTMCAWTENGRKKQRSFDNATLELVV